MKNIIVFTMYSWENYYRQVIKVNTNRELSAKVCILINILYKKPIFKWQGKLDLKKLPEWRKEYFVKLTKEYNDTQFYKKYVTHCPMLKQFE